MKTTLITALLVFSILSFSIAQLKVGDMAPRFSTKDDADKTWNSTDYIGNKILVIYFYPAAMTGGCTKQACAFRDDKAKFDGLDAVVVGISGDEVENLKYFKEAHNLNFPLLADPDGAIAKKFGVQMKDGGSIVRNIGGQDVTLERGVTTSRWTFIIDKSGRIAFKNTEVDAAEDSRQTIEAIKSLK
ncbi:MAG: peroxiredoxin [Cytophagales bacterium]|nr:peroxiredoxin [Cytophagales bacterium]